MEKTEEVGFIGLGRMGMGMVSRILKNSKIKVYAWNRSLDKVEEAEKKGAIGCKTVKELINKFKTKKRVIWMMLPAGEATETQFKELINLVKKGDIILDGGNANFHDSIKKHELAQKKSIQFLDVGVSGGIVAIERGYAMMIGGKKETYDYCLQLFEAMCTPKGYNLVGPGGSGHYVKMIHNAIEYGMMQSIAEGFDLLKNGRFEDLDLEKITKVWNNGTIISSFLMEMTEKALKNNNNDLKNLEPWVDDSGEGQWAAIEALEKGIPFVSNSYATHIRRVSRGKSDFSFRLLGAIRNEFGGHIIKKSDEKI